MTRRRPCLRSVRSPDVADALQLLALHERLDPLRDLLGADEVGEFGDDDPRFARCELSTFAVARVRNVPRPVR